MEEKKPVIGKEAPLPWYVWCGCFPIYAGGGMALVALIAMVLNPWFSVSVECLWTDPPVVRDALCLSINQLIVPQNALKVGAAIFVSGIALFFGGMLLEKPEEVESEQTEKKAV